MKIKEEWKPMADNEEKYEVSSLGRIRTKARRGANPKNRWGRPHTFLIRRKLRKYNTDKYGYYNLSISSPSGKRMTLTVHRLVAKTFLRDSYFEGAHVNHKNSNRKDNRVENLEWVTCRENVIHSFKQGNRTGGKGEKNSMAVLSEKSVLKMRERYKAGQSFERLAKDFGVSITAAKRAAKGLSWKHL